MYNSVINTLVKLDINNDIYHIPEILWSSFTKNGIYRDFFTALLEKNIDEMLLILQTFRENYYIEFNNMLYCNFSLLEKYNKLNKMNCSRDDDCISNISNFGISEDILSKCHRSKSGSNITNLSIRYYFTYILLEPYITEKCNILEIGCCSVVGVASQILKYKSSYINCILLCDLIQVLVLSYATILYNFPHLKVLFYNGKGNVETLTELYNIILIIPDYLIDFKSCRIEFCFNSYSFSEMSKENLDYYFNFLTKTTRWLISENKHLQNGNQFRSLIHDIPANFIKIKETDNCNCPDSFHNIYHLENTLYGLTV